MRIVITALILGFSVSIFGQIKTDKPEVLVEYHDIAIGDSLVFDEYEIKFVDVTTDSRCPKAVICVREGEANIEVEVYKSNELVSKKKLIFTSMVVLPSGKGNLFNSDFLKVTGAALHPYPITDNQILKENYKLKLLFEELVN